MIRVFIFTVFFMIVNVTFSQKIYFEKMDGSLDSTLESSIIIVAGDLNCGLCFEKLNKVLRLKYYPKGTRIILYYDSQSLPEYARYAKAAELKAKIPDLNIEIVFYSIVSNDNNLVVCPPKEQPYLLIFSNEKRVFLCNQDIFGVKKSNKQLRKEILSYISS